MGDRTMRVPEAIYVNKAVYRLPSTWESAEGAVAAGVVTADEVRGFHVRELPVAVGETAESMALDVATAALADSDPRDIAFLVHACVGENPAEWKAAPRLARLLGADRAVATGLRQMCNGGSMGLQLAVAHLLTEPRSRECLVVTSDALGPGWRRRWQRGFGDGATALAVSRRPGPVRILAMSTSGRPAQEVMYPAESPFRPGIPAEEVSDDLGGKMVFRLRGCVRDAVRDACADAGLDPADPSLSVVMTSRVTAAIADALVSGVVHAGVAAELVSPYAGTGHLFAGDLAANLALLVEQRRSAGEHALLVTFGGGFSATCAVVRMEADDAR